MIYFFYSEGNDEGFKKASKLFSDLRNKKPDASFAIYDVENFSAGILQEALSSSGLFEKKIVLWLKGVIEEKENDDFIIPHLKDLKESENIFIFSGNKASGEIIKKIEKVSEKSVVDTEKAKKPIRFNVFSLTDAFRNRDKKNMWLLYHEALKNNVSSEEIQGILFWQIKSMLQASITNSVEETDLKQFSYMQSKQALKNYSKEELEAMILSLVEIYHEAHLGTLDFETKLEEFVLSV